MQDLNDLSSKLVKQIKDIFNLDNVRMSLECYNGDWFLIVELIKDDNVLEISIPDPFIEEDIYFEDEKNNEGIIMANVKLYKNDK